MIRKPYKTNKNISRLFYILMMIIFVWFIGIQILGPDEQFFDQSGHSIIYNGTFTWKKSDGTKQNISVPGRYKVPAKQTMIITTTLPDDYNENVIAIRSSLQDVRFYIDGKLRKEYNAKSLHRFGKNSASRYIFCNTSSADAGKELRLELTTYTSNYSGVVNTIYCGDQMQIWSYIFNHNFSGTVIGSFIFFASIVTILFSIALGIVYKTKFNMEYLGWCTLMGSVWMIGESKMRQILVPNASGLATSCFIMLMLCPLPISLYVNNLQKGKYKKIFQSICFIALLNFIICTILHLTGVADYIETMPAAHAILIITFLAVILTFLFFCPGYNVVYYWRIRGLNVVGHGPENFVQGIQNSCNPVFIEGGFRLGVDRLFDYFREFGRVELSGVDIPGEAGTIMHKKENVGQVELATISFGQSFQITPIQLATTVSALVNGGRRVTPHFGMEVLSEEGKKVKTFRYNAKKHIVSEKTSQTMRELLESVVAEGSGKNAYVEGYRIGGKTATSQPLPRSANKYISSFVGFAPADDPQILGMCVIYNPQGVYYGGTIAAPVIGKIFENILPYLGIEKQ